MEFSPLPIKPRYNGLRISRHPKESIFIAEIGLITFEGYGDTRSMINVSTRDLEDGKLSLENKIATLDWCTIYQIVNAPVRITCKPWDGSTVDIFLQALQHVKINRAERLGLDIF